jgi:putative ABC transport system permease protein
MLAIITTNLLRRRARTAFTAFGIAVGVGMVVALLAFTSGFKTAAGQLVHLGRSDFGVFQANVSDPTASILPASFVGRLAARHDVAAATPLVLMPDALPSDPGAIVFGADPAGFFSTALVITSGARAAGHGQVLVGDRLASQLHLAPGGRLIVKGHPLTVAGVYHSGILFEDLGAVLDLPTAQAIASLPNEETDVVVRVAPNARADVVARDVAHRYSGVQTISDPDQALRAGANGLLVTKAILVIAFVALLVGALSVANTMAMSIAERQSELGLLSTVGWAPSRVAMLVLGEGVFVSVLGAGLGLILGVFGGRLLVNALGVNAYISPSITAWVLGRGLLVGIAIGVLGGIFPAWRVTRMKPLRVLEGT